MTIGFDVREIPADLDNSSCGRMMTEAGGLSSKWEVNKWIHRVDNSCEVCPMDSYLRKETIVRVKRALSHVYRLFVKF